MRHAFKCPDGFAQCQCDEIAVALDLDSDPDFDMEEFLILQDYVREMPWT